MDEDNQQTNVTFAELKAGLLLFSYKIGWYGAFLKRNSLMYIFPIPCLWENVVVYMGECS